MFSLEEIQSFWNLVDSAGGDDACWPWMGYRRVKGHGVFFLKYTSISAHRIAFMLVTGIFLPTFVIVRHQCHRPWCCNPAHHELGSVVDNNADRVRAQRGATGARNGQAKLTVEKVAQIRATSIPHKTTAREYGVSATLVRMIRRGEIWKEATQ